MKVLSIPALEPQKTVILFILINDFQFVFRCNLLFIRLNLTLKNNLFYVNANFKNFSIHYAFIHHGIVIF
jgi:hypothetical protein